MPKIVHVAKAQQRYVTVPVLDDDGNPKRTPVMKKDGSQKTTKRGRPVFMNVTVADKTQPLPPSTCDYPGCQHPDRVIAVGTPYKHLTVKTGPSSSRTYRRHADCPNWQEWDYSNSTIARIARIVHDAQQEIAAATEAGEVESALSSAAEQIREIAEEKHAASASVEEGFGHETQASVELAEQGDNLDEWANEIEGTSVPEPDDCTDCDGTGETDGIDDHDDENDGEKTPCETCDGEGRDLDAWRDTIESDVASVLDNSPL